MPSGWKSVWRPCDKRLERMKEGKGVQLHTLQRGTLEGSPAFPQRVHRGPERSSEPEVGLGKLPQEPDATSCTPANTSAWGVRSA